MNNQFQTDPLQSEPVVRHPFAFGIETTVSDRLAVEAALSDGIGLGFKVGLLDEDDSPIDLGIGFDQLMFPVESHLFGKDSISLARVPGRAWVGVAQTWEFLRARAAVSMQIVVDGIEYVPHFAMETAFHLPVSIGWDAAWEGDEFRQTVGLSARVKSIEIAGGLSEFQAWIFRDRTFGWFDAPPVGKLDGIGNPGWWLSVKWDLPPLRATPPPVIPIASCPAPQVDAPATQPAADDHMQQVMLRQDVAELAERTGSEITSNPLTMAVLRRRILSGGPPTRQALWKIALDSSVRLEDRRQAVVTLGFAPQEADLDGLVALAEDPAPGLRLEAAMGLGQLQAPSALQTLKVLARDPEEAVRLAAQAAVESRSGH